VRFDLNNVFPKFVSYQINSPRGKSYFLAHATKTTGIATINQKVRTIPVSGYWSPGLDRRGNGCGAPVPVRMSWAQRSGGSPRRGGRYSTVFSTSDLREKSPTATGSAASDFIEVQGKAYPHKGGHILMCVEKSASLGVFHPYIIIQRGATIEVDVHYWQYAIG
jgi:hypothetical protein